MQIPEIGEVITPVDDPCQFNPAWRSIIAGYLFSIGVRTDDDFESLSKMGCLVNIVEDSVEVEPEKTKQKTKSKSKDKKVKEKPKIKVVKRKVSRRIEPFYDHSEYRTFVIDKYIRLLVNMFNDEVDGLPVLDEYVPIKLATRWYSEIDHEAALKKRLEPLLLTGIGMDIITLDLVGIPSAQPAIEAYERLYFNCRIDDFTLNPSAQLIQRIAMPYGPLKTHLKKFEFVDEDGFVIGDGRPLAKDSDVWKAIAATMGYEPLMYVWKWDRFAHGIKDNSIEHMIDLSWKVSTSKLFADLYNGDIMHEDAARLLSAYTAQAKKITDDRNGRHDSGEDDTTKALMAVLYQVSPKMVEFTEEDEKSRNDDIQSRIQSQLAIANQAIEDNGKQVETEIIDAQISNAITQ
jgi:hypothetical protein